MSRALPLLALGLLFFLGGIALFAFTMRQKDKLAATTPKRKSDERALAVEKRNNVKMRVAGGILAGFGALLLVVSSL